MPPIAKPLEYLEKVKVMTTTKADQVSYAATPRNNAATHNVIKWIEISYEDAQVHGT